MQLLNAAEMSTEKQTDLLYGPPGMGKTTLLGQLPGKTLIVDVDRGTSVLQGKANIDVVRLDESLSDLPKVLEMLEKNNPYDNVCIDSLSELEKAMLTVYGREGKNDGAPEQGHYLKVQFKIADYCRRFRALSGNTIFTAWEMQKEIIAQDGSKYTQARPMLGDKSVDLICGLCDVVGRIVISTKDGERYVWFEASQTVVAKDRLRKRKYCKFEEVV
ncbi:MAG TPA: AAA family ATPase [Opitutales bacterium]|nr:AAA family ATPase [Opitutales bacterium]